VVKRLLADWKTVWIMAMKGAMRRSRMVASQPRWGRDGTSPTTATAPRSTAWQSMAMWVETRIPSQSVTVPEKKRKMVVAVVKRVTA
jgi:hypothetical protein